MEEEQFKKYFGILGDPTLPFSILKDLRRLERPEYYDPYDWNNMILDSIHFLVDSGNYSGVDEIFRIVKKEKELKNK